MNVVTLNFVKPRFTHFMHESVTKPNLPIGTKFVGSNEVLVQETINNVLYSITWIQMPDGYWIPKFLEYTGLVYYKEDVVVPPSSIITHAIDIDTSNGKIRIDGGPWQ